jgi:phospholipid/cholesterol/gamma-HCH transport system substrate-binding protein
MTRTFNRTASHRASRPTILISALVAGLLLAALIYLAAVAPRGVPLISYYYVNADFSNASNIDLLATVDIAGRDVGQVSHISYQHGLAVLKLQMFPGTQKLTSDATARIRQKNPIGAKYVEVTPNPHGTVLQGGATMPVSRTSTAVDTQTLLNGLTPPARTGLTNSVTGLGEGFLGRGTGINEALTFTAPELQHMEATWNAILARPGSAARLVPSAESMAAAYEPVRTQLAAGFEPQAQVLQDFADERANLQSTLDVAPSSLGALRVGLAESQPLLDQMTGFARATVKLTAPAPAALRAATTFLKTATPSLRRTLPLLRSIDAAVPSADSMFNTVYPALSPSVRLLSNQMSPLQTLAAHSCDYLSWASNWRSMLEWGVPGNYDPSSDLTATEPGLGRNVNSFRNDALVEDSTEITDADNPGNFPHGADAYPAPCTATSQTDNVTAVP